MPLSTRSTARDVFCNFPFDEQYENLCLSLIAAVLCTGQTPRTVLEIPARNDRLSRLVTLLESCPFSIHDLSNVRLSGSAPMRVPRFNMPFELGLAVALSKKDSRHQFAILERMPYRLQRSLSDLNGYDPVIHHGTPIGMFEAICDVFAEARPFLVGDAAGFRKVYRALTVFRRRQFARRTIYTRDPFFRLVVAAREYVRQQAVEGLR